MRYDTEVSVAELDDQSAANRWRDLLVELQKVCDHRGADEFGLQIVLPKGELNIIHDDDFGLCLRYQAFPTGEHPHPERRQTLTLEQCKALGKDSCFPAEMR